ncbi:chemotaxis protein CheR [Rheinheimera sp. UJ51]|uniref:CheR family methyltransferase n=1 Tax=Rheinheimera sp. UJ51 TaxID=2892446 RepID=UPI001E5C412D|nr:CheR family methyltransferase [Rheinheimera sp. UJ51]MCC5451831.1 chemotaxis protein CheR [Rheinheimera sp. UJ51]
MVNEAREFSFDAADFEAIRRTLYQLAGIKLSDSKQPMVYSRLSRRLRALKMASFRSYLRYLAEHKAETENFINALTTNLTAFFREPHHFDMLEQYLRRHPEVKNIWCAASSTGEEPYSIAMTVAKVKQRFNTGISIIASDIDSKVLAQAKTAIYTEDKVERVPLEYKKQFFQRGSGSNAGLVRVVPELAKTVLFRQINLLDKQWPVRGPLDIIFCRNVMIYFDKPTQEQLLARMISLLSPTGLYFAGHSENFSHLKDLVHPVGKTTYRAAQETMA